MVNLLRAVPHITQNQLDTTNTIILKAKKCIIYSLLNNSLFMFSVNFVRENEKSRIRCETVNPDSASKYKIITMSHLVNEKKWRDLKDHFRWEQSGKSDGYFRLTENKKAPLPGTLTIGNVKVVDLKTCVRLCIRVGGCMAFAFTTSGSDVNKCLLFDVIPVPLIMQSNVKFFVKKGVTY